jgi:uncharacterized protein
MKPGNLIKDRRNDILRLSKLHGAKNVCIFGSVARDKAGPDSDVDFLVEMVPGRSLLDLAGLAVDLERLLGRKVDIVTERGLHWYLRDKILNEAQAL